MKVIAIKISNKIRGATLTCIPITCIIRCKADIRGISEKQPFLSE